MKIFTPVIHYACGLWLWRSSFFIRIDNHSCFIWLYSIIKRLLIGTIQINGIIILFIALFYIASVSLLIIFRNWGCCAQTVSLSRSIIVFQMLSIIIVIHNEAAGLYRLTNWIVLISGRRLETLALFCDYHWRLLCTKNIYSLLLYVNGCNSKMGMIIKIKICSIQGSNLGPSAC